MKPDDGDGDPTHLYTLIRHKVWAAAKIRATNYPREVRTFTSRKEQELTNDNENMSYPEFSGERVHSLGGWSLVFPKRKE